MAFDINILPQWKGKYPMADTADADDLQMRSDIYEHMHRMPRHEAEAAAHNDYRKEQIAQAAAHHWNGMKAAHAADNIEGAKKHGVMYVLALHQLGHKDLLNPPPEVLEAAKSPKQAIGNFKAHPADAYSMPPAPPDDGARKPKLNEKQVKDAAAAAKPMVKSQEGDRSEPEQTPVAEVQSPKCTSCGGPFHPDTGHHPPGYDNVNVCGPCMHHFVDWLKQHLKRPYGSKETPFYEAAATSIKPGMNKAEGDALDKVTDQYPADHKLGMEVPPGGSTCAKCSFVSEDLKKCGNDVFQKWNGGPELPKPADRYCCDLFKIGQKK